MLTAAGTTGRFRVVACVLALVITAVLLASCSESTQDGNGSGEAPGMSETRASRVGHDASVVGTGTPALVDLGSDTCVPCKMMEPILEELAAEFDGLLHVVFINTREDRDAAQRFGVSIIPTQIFFDEIGEELFRHQGFFSREEILAVWLEHGYDFKAGADGADAHEPAADDADGTPGDEPEDV